MNTQEIIAKTLESTALTHQSEREGEFAYPKKWEGKVPLKIKMLETVWPDVPSRDLAPCLSGHEYYVYVNSFGAVSAFLPNGARLGLKPNEFEVIEWHPKSTNQ